MNQQATSVIADFKTRPMKRFQIMVIGLCFLINMLDGMDVFVVAFTAPAIAHEWGLSPDRVGLIFSSGLAGMVVGSLFLAPLADKAGRRKMILLCLSLITIGMCAAAFTATLQQLILARLLTGLGVGAMLPSLVAQVAEYASAKRRSFAISLLQVGFVLGGTLSGVLAASLVSGLGWRAVYVAAGLGSAILIPVVYFILPESLDFLFARKPGQALQKINYILLRLGERTLVDLPESESKDGANTSRAPRQSTSLAAIISPVYVLRTMLIWTTFFMTMFVVYFVLNWTPQTLVAAGMPVTQGIGSGIVLNFGGMLGALILGYVTVFFGLARLLATFMMLAIISMVTFALIDDTLFPMLIAAFFVGFFTYAVMIGLSAVVPGLYPAEIRTTGIGWAIGIGRLGAIAGPYAAGLLIAQGWERALYYSALSLPLLIAAAGVLYIGDNQTRK